MLLKSYPYPRTHWEVWNFGMVIEVELDILSPSLESAPNSQRSHRVLQPGDYHEQLAGMFSNF